MDLWIIAYLDYLACVGSTSRDGGPQPGWERGWRWDEIKKGQQMGEGSGNGRGKGVEANGKRKVNTISVIQVPLLTNIYTMYPPPRKPVSI